MSTDNGPLVNFQFWHEYYEDNERFEPVIAATWLHCQANGCDWKFLVDDMNDLLTLLIEALVHHKEAHS